MATGEGFPLRQGAGTGLDWFLMAIEARGGGTPDLGYFLEVFVFIGIFGVGFTSGGVSESSTRVEGAPYPPGRVPISRGRLGDPLA